MNATQKTIALQNGVQLKISEALKAKFDQKLAEEKGLIIKTKKSSAQKEKEEPLKIQNKKMSVEDIVRN